MSTRAQVIIKDASTSIWFYRHSDGYPEGTLPSLRRFLDLVSSGRIRRDAMQASGWLVLIGAEEYNNPLMRASSGKETYTSLKWKVGAYEPCDSFMYVDIEYLYTIDLRNDSITIKEI